MPDNKLQNLEKRYLSAIIDATTSPSPELDKFSTWLTGGAAASIALSISSLDSLISNIGQGYTKGFIVILAFSILLGLMQKILAIQISALKTVDKAAEEAQSKIAELHSEEKIRDASQYLQENTDTVKVAAHYLSSLPKPFRYEIIKSWNQSTESKPKQDRQLTRFTNQIQILGLQILTIFVAIGLVVQGI
ncbi:hypothetical protein [Ectopseudomonas composti]|uniref:hypothetical protein n=1 Tax=Ectopseudomonas composti TaxID=658457 RepID=UPI000ABB50FF|nr:hypothetical protein [Pseudomonas composti]